MEKVLTAGDTVLNSTKYCLT